MAESVRGEKTRNEIISSALRLFALHGYSNTSMSDLLEAVSLSKGAFYHHFRSKEALALAVLESVRDEYNRELAGWGDGRLIDMLDRMVQLNSSGKWSNCLLLVRFVNEVAGKEDDLSRSVGEILEWLTGCWEDAIKASKEAGELSVECDSRRMSEMILAMIFGAVANGGFGEEVSSLGRVVSVFKSEVLNMNQKA